MMNATVTRATDIPALSRDEAKTLAATEYQRFDDLIASLSDADWSRPTDNTRWNVKQVVSHTASMATMVASMREMMRQQKAGKPLTKSEGLSKFDSWTEYQALQYADLAPSDLVKTYRDAVPAAAATRARTSPLRLVRFPDPNYGWFSLAYLRDDILTRDVWMHRVDISRAVGRDVVVTPEHDGRFVRNIVRELAKRWKKPFDLELTGSAGGHFVNGTGAARITVDAVEFCRILSGRSEGHGLPTDVVPF
jgi:uncharacterized protein (TIGR03083 family)